MHMHADRTHVGMQGRPIVFTLIVLHAHALVVRAWPMWQSGFWNVLLCGPQYKDIRMTFIFCR